MSILALLFVQSLNPSFHAQLRLEEEFLISETQSDAGGIYHGKSIESNDKIIKYNKKDCDSCEEKNNCIAAGLFHSLQPHRLRP